MSLLLVSISIIRLPRSVLLNPLSKTVDASAYAAPKYCQRFLHFREMLLQFLVSSPIGCAVHAHGMVRGVIIAVRSNPSRALSAE